MARGCPETPLGRWPRARRRDHGRDLPAHVLPLAWLLRADVAGGRLRASRRRTVRRPELHEPRPGQDLNWGFLDDGADQGSIRPPPHQRARTGRPELEAQASPDAVACALRRTAPR